MNRIKELRMSVSLSVRKLGEISGISYGVLSKLELGIRPLREIHISKLSYLFDVSSDYLLGYSNVGIGVFFSDNEHYLISKDEYKNLLNNGYISETLLKRNVTPTSLDGDYIGQNVVFREATIERYNADIIGQLKGAINEKLDLLGENELKKVLQFIKDYIIR